VIGRRGPVHAIMLHRLLRPPIAVIPWLDNVATRFPPTSSALPRDSEAPGLLAVGGDLSPERLRAAYSRGVFPWYSAGQPVLWWSPDPRMVLPAAEFRVSRSLRKTLQRYAATPGCEIRVDSALRTVMRHCATVPRDGQRGTWIVPEMLDAYGAWAERQGTVHSFETWIDGELAGGLYGVALGRMFYGESMFALRTDASKIALAALVCFCRAHGVELIDCQQNTEHLASLGAREIARAEFERHVARASGATPIGDWTYDSRLWAELGIEPRPAPRTSAR
jgi:leucyl/phenylalanyl-tRNA--protein transferase